jgi:hypothetical protein
MQFGIRTLLVLTLLAAVACGVFFAAPIVLGMLLLMIATLALAAVLVAGTVYGRGGGRAFAIGGLAAYGAWVVAGVPIVFVSMTTFDSSPFGDATTLAQLMVADRETGHALRHMVTCWPAVLVGGPLALAVRHWATPGKGDNRRRDDPDVP